MARVSVVIPTYNRPEYLPGAVETALAQTYDDLEVIVVDDGSDREYADEVAQEYGVSCVRHEENRGLSAARNTGIKAAQGGYVAFLDDDDRWHKTKIERQVEVLDGEPEIGLVSCYLAAISPEGNVLRCEASKPDGDLSNRIYLRNLIGTPSRVLVRKECFDEVGDFDERLPTKQDWDLYIRICQDWRVVCLEDLLCYRTVHHSMSSDPEDAEHDLMKIRRRYEEDIKEAGMWEESMAEYHEKIGVTYLHDAQPGRAREHLSQAVKTHRSLYYVLLYLLAFLPPWGFNIFIKHKRLVESRLNNCRQRSDLQSVQGIK